MKLEVDLPENHNGWLIAGKNVMYGNTPLIQISLISGFFNLFTAPQYK